MKTTTRVAVIGGGVVGASVLYHLTKLGWSDVMLLERSELTSGSTWHAAGGFHTLNGDTNMAALQGYTISLYKELEEITGMSCGLHHVGGVTLADNQDRFDMLLAERAKHRFMGLETEIVGPEEIAKIAPSPISTALSAGFMTRWMGTLTHLARPTPTPRPRVWAGPRLKPTPWSARPTSAPTARGMWSPTKARSTPSMS